MDIGQTLINIIPGIISLLTLVIGLVIALNSLINTIRHPKVMKLDPSIKVSQILRYPLSKENWEEQTSHNPNEYSFSALSLIGVLFVGVSSLMPLIENYIIQQATFENQASSTPSSKLTRAQILTLESHNLSFYTTFFFSIVFTIFFLLLCVVGYLYYNDYMTHKYNLRILRSNDPHSGRFILFEKAEITVETSFNYIFEKCHQSLRDLKFGLTDVDYQEKKIEAIRGNTIMVISLEDLENKTDVYRITFSCKVIGKDKNFFVKSRVTNSLINQIVGLEEQTKK